MTNVFIHPTFSGEDKGDGGIRRVVEAQHRWLPEYGINIVERIDAADVLAAHIYASDRLLKAVDKPLVIHNHGLYWAEYDWQDGAPDNKLGWQYKANEMCMESIRQADIVTGPSNWVSQTLRRHTLREVIPLWHGVDLEDWLDTENKGFVLWNKNRTDPVCDPTDLDELAMMAPDIQFISTFSYVNPLNVTVTGQQPYETAKRLVKDCAVYLLTPRETFGIGALEAMAAGKPVLAWKWGGQAEFIRHGVTGFLAQPGNFEELAEGLHFCLENREKLGAAARKDIEERFQWKDRIKPYADIYTAAYRDSMEERPRVSIVVPAYKLADLLPRALQSIKEQSMEDYECIIVDDASPDDTGKVAREFAKTDARFRVIKNKTNQYLAGALNVGIAEARGKYVLPLDADNEITSSTLDLLATALDKDRSIHIAYGNVEFVEPDGRRWHSGWPLAFSGDWQTRKADREAKPGNYVPSTALYRRDVWKLTGGYRRRYRTAEDADFWTRATSYGFRAAMVTEADTLIYHNREGSMSRVETMLDWTEWYPWARDEAIPPAGIIREEQVPVQSYDPAKVTVVIPVGPGHEEIYIDAIDSVMAQTMQDFDVVLVNDSGKPLRWIPTWATYIETPGKVGVAAARNMGIAASTSRLFLPLDADDILTADALQWLVDAWLEHGGYIYGDWYDVWEDDPNKETTVWETEDYAAARLITHGCLHSVTALYERADWERVKGFDETVSAWEDWDFQLKFAEIGVCGTRVAAPIFLYRKDKGSRREDNYANFEASKAAIYDRWKDYFDGRKELMGCNSCGGNKTVQVQQQLTSSARGPIIPDERTDLTIIEYVGNKEGGIVYTGPSGQAYRFANDEGERVRYVLPEDVDYFRMREEFRVRASVPTGAPA